MNVSHIWYLSAFLFTTGIVIIIVKRNAIMMLMGIELLLNAANLNLVSLGQLHPDSSDGQMFALLVIVVAVSETAVGLAIIMQVYKYYHTSVPDQVGELKD
jgi:NADH:ubiquinone oxidoreductase subunit K